MTRALVICPDADPKSGSQPNRLAPNRLAAVDAEMCQAEERHRRSPCALAPIRTGSIVRADIREGSQ
jgi:hypothetical protein